MVAVASKEALCVHGLSPDLKGNGFKDAVVRASEYC